MYRASIVSTNRKTEPTKFKVAKFKVALITTCAAVLLYVSITAALAQASGEPQISSHKGQPQKEIDSSFEAVLVAEQYDTFSSIALREFGTIQLASALADYNKLPLDTIFAADEELVYPNQISPKPDYAEVAFTKGQVSYLPGGSQRWQRAITQQERLYTTDIIETGPAGFVSFVLSSGAVVNVQPTSRIRIEQLHCLPDDDSCIVEIDVEDGGLNSNVTKREGQDNHWVIDTPYASAAVRGTIFDVDSGQRALRVGVTDGTVDVGNDLASIDLQTGFGITVEAGKTPGTPVLLLPKPNVMALPPRLTQEDIAVWKSLDGASSYAISYSLDESGNESVYLEELESTTHKIESLDPGHYYVTVRAIDGDGLVGFPHISAFNRVALDSDVAIPVVAIDRESNQVFLSIESNESAHRHEFQIATDPDFHNITSVDTPPNGGIAHQLLQGMTHYARARVITADGQAGRYGEVVSIGEETD